MKSAPWHGYKQLDRSVSGLRRAPALQSLGSVAAESLALTLPQTQAARRVPGLRGPRAFRALAAVVPRPAMRTEPSTLIRSGARFRAWLRFSCLASPLPPRTTRLARPRRIRQPTIATPTGSNNSSSPISPAAMLLRRTLSSAKPACVSPSTQRSQPLHILPCTCFVMATATRSPPGVPGQTRTPSSSLAHDASVPSGRTQVRGADLTEKRSTHVSQKVNA